MANKQKKKRNKVYRGVDAALTKPVITRIAAVNRNPVNQWWFDHKRIARPVLIAAAVLLAILFIIYQLVHLATNS